MTDGGEPAAAPDWVRLRQDYETAARPAAEIAAEAGMSRSALIARARREGWKLRGRRKSASTRQTIVRLKDLLQKRLGELEGELGAIGAEVTAATTQSTTTINTAAATSINGASTVAGKLVWVRGRVRINAAGTFIPQFTFSVAPGAAPTLYADSYFRTLKLAADTKGTWA